MSVQRLEPLHVQVAEIYKHQIATGELAEGDRLPTVRQMARIHDIAPGTAAKAVELLAAQQLVETRGRGGTVVGRRVLGPRLVLGPQQLLALAEPVPGQVTTVRDAEMLRVPGAAPQYVVPVLDLLEVKAGWWNVYRREQVTEWPGGPRLEVSWFRPEWAGRIPPLSARAPVMPLGGVAALIAEASGDPVVRGWHGVEARPAKADGREDVLFGGVGAPLLAAVYTWVTASGLVAEYGEYCLPQRRAIEHHYGVTSG